MRRGIAVVGLPGLAKQLVAVALRDGAALAGTTCTLSRSRSFLDNPFRLRGWHVFRPGVHELSGLKKGGPDN